MSVSRIDKLVHGHTGAPSLAQTRSSRNVQFNIVLHDIEPVKRAVMAHVATTLGLRCFTGPVWLYDDPGATGIWPHRGPLRKLILESAAAYGHPERIRWTSGTPSEGITLHIGAEAGGEFVADAAGWVAGVNTELPKRLPAEVPASVFAVSCTFAQLFNKTLLGRERRHPWTFSVRDLAAGVDAPAAHTLAAIDCGQVAVLGAGAIGSAFAYTVWLSNWTASLDIYDRESYDEPNLETTCLIGNDHVVQCRPKAPALAEAASRPGLRVAGHQVEIRRDSPELDIQRSTFVCAVDNPETRRILDSTRADLLLNAAVGGAVLDAGQALFTRHGVADPALSKRYPERTPVATQNRPDARLPEEVQDDCSRVAYEGVATAAPFIATATAAMLAAACAEIPPDAPNYLKLDLFGLQDRVDRRFLARG
jgi:molybdopterin/thiamine biosynthesis adenylyltransferase